MYPAERSYLEKCIQLIEVNIGIGKISDWKQRDFENLCELIKEKSNISLSLTTVKRILHMDVNQLPQKATLNALVQFVGYANWFDFIKSGKELSEHATKSNITIKKPRNKIFLYVLAIATLIGIAFFFVNKNYFQFNYTNNVPVSDSSFKVDSNAYKKFIGMALTPPLGWNTWNTFDTSINEQLIKDMADILVNSGMKDAGYKYLIIDDGWQALVRDSAGNLVANKNKFPNGIKALADYIHSKGLKIGLFSSAGSQSCKGLPGGRGHEFQDARTFAAWEIDYLKYDWCGHGTADAPETYRIMRDALYTAGRPMVYSICEWGYNQPWKWGKNVGHLWRTTGNITDCSDCSETFAIGWKNILDKQIGLEQYAGPDQWNDPDMLEVGNPGLSLKESKAHFSLWCMIAAPLIAGNDLRKMPQEVLEILTNKEAIAINQDPLGKQGYKYLTKDGIETWLKELTGGNWAFCFLNTNKAAVNLKINWMEYTMLSNDEYSILNIWKKKVIGSSNTPINIEIRSNDVLFIKLTKLK